jgi:hypothetical protein
LKRPSAHTASPTLTRKLQLTPLGIEQVTVVVPTAKNNHDGGLQVPVPHSSVTVTTAVRSTVAPQPVAAAAR